MEILSPVKNLQGAKAAVQAGADAVYFSSTKFGARTKASLELQEIKEIINYCNMRKVKTFMAFNTVIFNDEINDFLSEIKEVYSYGVEGVLIQDIAFVDIIKEMCPNLEVHASTQMNIGNLQGAKLLENLNADRVVLPREMSIKEIVEIKKNMNLDVEVFIHGALCVSVSGQCYDSTLLDQKSANRGRCSQYCRMPQSVFHTRKGQVQDIDYPLNLKDMNNIDNVDKYIQAGIDSLKIEGRLKPVDYVYQTTKAYKSMGDNTINLNDVYNREYSKGFVLDESSSNLLNENIPNNTGYEIGHVYKVERNTNKELMFYKRKIYVEALEELNKLDNIRYLNDIFNQDGQKLEKYEKIDKNKYAIYSNCEVQNKSKIYRTKNVKQLSDIEHQIEKENKRISINVNFEVINNVLYFELENKKYESNVVFEEAKNRAITKNDILDKIKKTKNTPFDICVDKFDYNEQQFCMIKEVNALKKEIIEKYEQKNSTTRNVDNLKVPEFKKESVSFENNNKTYHFEVKTLEQYMYIKPKLEKLGIDYYIWINNIDEMEEFSTSKKDFIVLPNAVSTQKLKALKKQLKNVDNIVISELGALAEFKDKNMISNFTINTTNNVNKQFLNKNNINKSLLSIELNKDKLVDFAKNNSIINIYGRVPVMTMVYCPINKNKIKECGSCTKCRNNSYYLKDDYDREFPLFYGGNDKMQILSHKPISLIKKIEEIFEMGYNELHIRFTNENIDEMENILEAIFENKEVEIETNIGSFYKETL